MLVSTIASKSVFSAGGHVLDSFCTSLTCKIVEVVICAQDWLCKSHNPLMLEENFLELDDLKNSNFSCSYCTCIYVFIHIHC